MDSKDSQDDKSSIEIGADRALMVVLKALYSFGNPLRTKRTKSSSSTVTKAFRFEINNVRFAGSEEELEGVEKLVVPRNKEERNSDKLTPAEVFTNTHMKLVKRGEKWMRGTATSCTFVAALIATVVFAAAITIPGGNDSNGHPIFSKKPIFLLFIICDAFALFSSISSVLLFLSILTSRYGEDDFHVSLPRILYFGLITLFLSILSTMIAFGVILYLLVFGKSHKEWIAIPFVVLPPSIPVVLYLRSQYNLLFGIYTSTYQNIFVKQSDGMLY
ncbi:hypothetical protein HYC85_000270 [Camellia sinensis]|uniref:PGG domain-containing protein n=1 Tax=Camellia sinensis TaxID=4442 RepID=A0A7J7I3C6_CAMSI|nr:hypothetical protein HYC85_000270 [Camellia sinensis]